MLELVITGCTLLGGVPQDEGNTACSRRAVRHQLQVYYARGVRVEPPFLKSCEDRDRTCDRSVTRNPTFLPDVDYIITSTMTC